MMKARVPKGVALVLSLALVVPVLAAANPARAFQEAPPPEVINCVRPFAETTDDQLQVSRPPTAKVDAALRRITIELPPLPAGVTCYSVWREPSDTGPVALKWDARGLAPSVVTVEEALPPYSGEYCYYVVVGSTRGHSSTEAPRGCVTVPDSLAPSAPTLPPSDRTPLPPFLLGPTNPPSAPDAGTGIGRTGSSQAGDRVLALGVLSVIALAVAGVILVRSGRRPR